MSTLPSVAEVRRSIPSPIAARSVSSDGAGASSVTSQENAGGTALPAVSNGAGRSPMRRGAQPTALRIATIYDNRLSQASTSADGASTRLHHGSNAGNVASGVSIITDKLLLDDNNFAKSSGTTSAGLSPQQSLVGETLSPDTRTRPLGTPSPGTACPRRSLPNMAPSNGAGASVRPAGLRRSFSPNAPDSRRAAATQPHTVSTSSPSLVYDTGRVTPHYQMSQSEWPASPSTSSQIQPRPPVQVAARGAGGEPGEEPPLASGVIQSLHAATLHAPSVAQMSPRVARMQLAQAPSSFPYSALQPASSQQLTAGAEEPPEVPAPPSPGAVPLDTQNSAAPPPPPLPQALNQTTHPAASASGIPPLPPQHQQHQQQGHLSGPSDNGGGAGSSSGTGIGAVVAASPGDSRLLADLAAAVVDLQRRVAEMTPRQGRDSYASDAGSGSSWWSRSNRNSVPGTIACDPSSLSILFSTNTSTSGAAPGPLGGGSATASTSALPACLAPSPADRLTAERLTAVELKLSQLAASTATAGMKPPPSPFWSESGEPQAPLPPLSTAHGHETSTPGSGLSTGPSATVAMGFTLGLAVAAAVAAAASGGSAGGQQGSSGARRALLGKQRLGVIPAAAAPGHLLGHDGLAERRTTVDALAGGAGAGAGAGAAAGVAEAAHRLDAVEQRLDAVLQRVMDTERRVSEQVSAGGAQARQLEQLRWEAEAAAEAARRGAEERHLLEVRLRALEEGVVRGGRGGGDAGEQVGLAARVCALEEKARDAGLEGLETRLQALEKRVVRAQEQQLGVTVQSQPSSPPPPQQPPTPHEQQPQPELHQQSGNAAHKAPSEVCATTLVDQRTEAVARRLAAVEEAVAGRREDVRHPSPAAPPRDVTSASVGISGTAAGATAFRCINNAGPAAAVEELQRGLQAVMHHVQDMALQVVSARAQSSSCASEIQAVLEQIHAVRTTATAAAASARQASTVAASAERMAEAALDAVDTSSVAARTTGGGRGRPPYDTVSSAEAASEGLTALPSRWEVWLPPEQVRKSLEEEMLDAISSGDGNLQSLASSPAPLAAEDSSTTVVSRQRRLSVGRDVGFHIRPDGADVATGGGTSLYGISPTRGNILYLTVSRLDELETALDELRSKLSKGLALRVTRDELRESVSSVELQLSNALEGLVSNNNGGNGNLWNGSGSGNGGIGPGNEHAAAAQTGMRGMAARVGSLHARVAGTTGAGISTEEAAGKGSGGGGGVSWAPGTGGQADGGGSGGSRGGLAAAAGVARPPKALDAQRVLSLCHGIASLGGGGGGGAGGGLALEDVGSGSIAARGRASFAWRAHTAGAVAAVQRAVEVLEQRMEVAEAGLLHQTGVDERVTALSDSVQQLQASASLSSCGRTASAVHSRSTSVKSRDNPILRGLDEQLVLLVHRVDASEELQGALDKEVRELAARVRALGSALEKGLPARPECD